MTSRCTGIFLIILSVFFFVVRYAPVIPFDLGIMGEGNASISQGVKFCSSLALLAPEKCGWVDFTNYTLIALAAIFVLIGAYLFIKNENGDSAQDTTFEEVTMPAKHVKHSTNKHVKEELEIFDDEETEKSNIFKWFKSLKNWSIGDYAFAGLIILLIVGILLLLWIKLSG